MNFPSPFRRRFRTPLLVTAIVLQLTALFGIELAAGKRSDTAEGLEILTPSPGATLNGRYPETHLVLAQPEGAEETRLKAAGSDSVLRAVEAIPYDGRTFLHFRLPLSPGKNVFTLLPSGRQVEFVFKKVHTRTGQVTVGGKGYVFHQGSELPQPCSVCHDLIDTDVIKPVGIKKYVSCASCHKDIMQKGPRKHSTTVNQQCLSCHTQSDYPLRIGFPGTNTAEICFTCHTGKKEWYSRAFPHGPLHVGGCTLCHDPHGDKHRYQLWAEGSMMLCITCHTDKQNLVDRENGLPYVHGIIFGKGCIACHNPHASDQEFMLAKPINDLCIECHPALVGVTRGHPVTRHPVKAPFELLRQGRSLTCSSCHDPHGGWHKKLLFETIKGARLCHACHDK